MSESLEKTQFRILYKDFLFRIVELDILTPGSEVQNLLVQCAATLAAVSFVLVVMLVLRPRRANIALWGDQEFLICTTIAIVGLFAVLAWNALLPDRRDCLILGPLPVSVRTMFLAKTAAISTALGGCVLAINLFTGFAYPVMVAPDGVLEEVPRMIAARLLSYRLFLRFSSFLQMAAFFVILAAYFLRPPLTTAAAFASPENQRLLHWMPSYWFLGLFQMIAGSTNEIFKPLAIRALWSTASAFSLAAATYGLAWYRNLRIIVEQPDIQPGDRTRPAGRIGRALVETLFHHCVDRAIVMFTSRSIARSRQHRLILAAYGGVGLAAALVYGKNYIYGDGIVLSRHVIVAGHWWVPNQPFLAAGLLLLLFAIVGMTSVFSLPIALPANWIFRLTAVHRPAAYFDAVRKSLYLLTAVPLWIVAGIAYFAIWPGRPALEHLVILVLTATILVEILLYQFRKIPFACSYLPGGGNVHMRLALGGVLFLFFVEIGTYLEYWTMLNPARWIPLASILIGVAIWRRCRSAEFNDSPHVSVQYEDYPDAEVSPLDLRQDGEWSNEQAYVDAIDPNFGRTWPQRLRPFAISALALVLTGFIYECIGGWRDKTRFPQVGRSVDIGGRSLNISCLGEGSPSMPDTRSRVTVGCRCNVNYRNSPIRAGTIAQGSAGASPGHFPTPSTRWPMICTCC